MRILHICNDYTGSKVHANLYRKLADKVESQVIYTYFGGKEKIGRNHFSSVNTQIKYDDILTPGLRKVYPLKLWRVYHHLREYIQPAQIDCVHATTLFSDGGVAYMLYKKFKIPYVVAVRATDLGAYVNHTRLIWPFGRRILLNANRILLINRTFVERLHSLEFTKGIWNQIKDRIEVIPNGIDDYWINNITTESKKNNYHICYAGTFVKRKNIPRLIKAVDIIHKDYPQTQLYLIGGGGEIDNEDDVVSDLAKDRSYVHLLGRITDNEVLKKIYQANSIFAMPSWSETFGLVYIEALTQNLRLLYSRNTGIDGLLADVGVAVDPMSVDSIAMGLRQLMDGFDQSEGNENVDFSAFDWNHISDRYLTIYERTINSI